MTGIVGLVDYGRSGNLFNVKTALELAGGRVNVVRDADGFQSLDRIVLPGVGSFREAMESIGGNREDFIREMGKRPTLGICLGMQILSKVGFEFGETAGLGLIDAEVKRMEVKCRVPHLGWGALEILSDSPLLDGVKGSDLFYFMHSYEVVNYKDVVALTDYCSHKFVSVLQRGSLYGVQFHPEKSRDHGLKVLENFLNL